MQITSTFKPQTLNYSAPVQAATKPEASQPTESFTFSDSTTSPLVKAGKYALAAVATAGAGALAFYAGSNLGTAATVAGVASGALAGGTVLGAVGLMGDVMGFMNNTNHTRTGAIIGGVAGAAAGGAIGAFVQSPAAGVVMGVASGIAALGITSAATNILAK
ncbi:MAG: hypothetical protein WC314_17585 [Vulcanimicrobiota bacterium]